MNDGAPAPGLPTGAPAPVTPVMPAQRSNFMSRMENQGVTRVPPAAPSTPATRDNGAPPARQQQPAQAKRAPDVGTREQPIGKQPEPPLEMEPEPIDPTATQEDPDADLDQLDTGAPDEPEMTATDEPAPPELVHGLDPADILEAIKAGTLPDGLLDALKIKVKPNGQEMMVSAREAGDGYMRLSDYSRSKKEAARLQTEAQGVLTQYQEFQRNFDGTLDRWRKDPPGAIEGLRELGLPIDAIAEHVASEFVRFNSLPPEKQRAELTARHEQQMARVRADADDKIARALAQAQQRPSQQAQDMSSTLDAGTPKAFASVGLPESPGATAIYVEHLKNLWQPGTELTQQHMDQAARAAREELEAAGIAVQAAAPAPGTSGTSPARQALRASVLPARAAAAPPPSTITRPKGGNSSSFAKFVEAKHDRAQRRR